MFNVLTKIFGSKNDREINRLRPIVEKINSLEPEFSKLSDADLKNKTIEFRQRAENQEELELMLPEAFAVVREASVRTLKMRHFDVQLIGGLVLHNGNIAEMKTGEGKTLAATLPAYLNALQKDKSVHIVTVNDYLAKRDTQWMGEIYNFLGLTVGNVVHGLDDTQRKKAYECDIVYGTNNEFGFDYLRDNMKFDAESLVQRDLNFAIVDEVDSILIDEARTPLIISGPAEKSNSLYKEVNKVIPRLEKESDFTIDEKAKSSVLTEEGIAKAEKFLNIDNLYDPQNIEVLHHINQALKAHTLFKKDVDYIIDNRQVVIVDEFTGRLMPGRRYSEGLHQAIEAKEGVKIEDENQTLATITFQNYFRMYDKLAGMTGTADTEAREFKKIYNLDVIVIPTNKDMVREDHPDAIYKTKDAKFEAVLKEIQAMNSQGRPVLVGTISVDDSEMFAKRLKKKKIPHNVLNAKNHKKEAEIISLAGQKGAVTISTNMAGRGTDIILGEGVAEKGGLHIIGTSRHESRRIDNQLRGRAGRQGDPGSSRFFLSLEDDLLRIFGGEKIAGIMSKIGMEEDEAIEHSMLSNAIERAQLKVESMNFDIRKQLIEYDDVMNQQREVIYKQRRQLLTGAEDQMSLEDIIFDTASDVVSEYEDKNLPVAEWNWDSINISALEYFGFKLDNQETFNELNEKTLTDVVYDKAVSVFKEKEAQIEKFRDTARLILLYNVDSYWKEHLLNMDHLKEGIGLRGYAQQNPLNVYKMEGYNLFSQMISEIKKATVKTIFNVKIVEESQEELKKRKQKQARLTYSGAGQEGQQKTPIRNSAKIGRNSPCPCGSGKKYKKCCGM